MANLDGQLSKSVFKTVLSELADPAYGGGASSTESWGERQEIWMAKKNSNVLRYFRKYLVGPGLLAYAFTPRST